MSPLTPQFIHSTYPLDDADLALIEINTSSPLVMKLIHEIRRLRDRDVCLQVENDDSYDDGYDDGFEEGKKAAHE